MPFGFSPQTAAPALSSGATTDNAVARFDGTFGLVQNSGVILDDSNNLTGLLTARMGTISAALAALAPQLGGNFGSGIAMAFENTAASGASTGASFVLVSNDGAAMASGDQLGQVTFGGSSTSSNIRRPASILAFAANNWTDGSDYGTYLDFQTAPTGSNSRTSSFQVGPYNGIVKLSAGYTVATLPAAGTVGRMAYVTDALGPTFLVAVIGGGAVKTPVFDNGTAWVSF